MWAGHGEPLVVYLYPDGRRGAPSQRARAGRAAREFPDILVALDFDGPIAPIVDRPDDARAVDTAPRALRRLAERGVPVAIVTGRDVETLLRLSGLSDLPGLTVLGVHGAQQWRGGELTQVPEPEGLAELRSVLPGVVETVDPAAWIEDKALSLVVHVRAARHLEPPPPAASGDRRAARSRGSRREDGPRGPGAQIQQGYGDVDPPGPAATWGPGCLRVMTWEASLPSMQPPSELGVGA